MNRSSFKQNAFELSESRVVSIIDPNSIGPRFHVFHHSGFCFRYMCVCVCVLTTYIALLNTFSHVPEFAHAIFPHHNRNEFSTRPTSDSLLEYANIHRRGMLFLSSMNSPTYTMVYYYVPCAFRITIVL